MPEAARELAAAVLAGCHVAEGNAQSVAAALVAAELIGQTGHGLRRLPTYAAQAVSGKVDGHAIPTATQTRPGTLAVDAAGGFAYPALDLALDALPEMAQANGVAVAAIRHSHHAGALGLVAERLADRGFAGLVFANSPVAMAPWGGREPLLGTNPIAFAAPAAGAEPIVVDLSLSKVARGRILAAKQRGESLPDGWAFDADGQPTTDPEAALAGTMAPLGDAKGAVLAIAVEAIAAGIAGANFAWEASSFFTAEGTPPHVGQLILAIDPTIGGPTALERLAVLAGRIEHAEGARLPGRRRQELRRRLTVEGIPFDAGLEAEIGKLQKADPPARDADCTDR